MQEAVVTAFWSVILVTIVCCLWFLEAFSKDVFVAEPVVIHAAAAVSDASAVIGARGAGDEPELIFRI